MIDLRFVPMDRPDKVANKTSTFKSTYSQTLDLLESELNKLGAKLITIQAGYSLPDIRNDGWPRAAAKPSHPACALQLVDRRGLQLVFRSHKFCTFESNLRAIALTLESLRAVDRYGVVEGEQYSGFRQLAAPEPLTRLQAATWLSHATTATIESILASGTADLDVLYRAAACIMHPDRGGSTAQFQKLQEVMGILRGAK